MRKLGYLFIVMMIATGLFMQSCEKDRITKKEKTAEISFGIEQGNFDLKTDTPECNDALEMDYVKFTLEYDNGGTTPEPLSYKSSIIIINGKPKTKAVKLFVEDGGVDRIYNLTSFLVYDDNGTPEDESDDILAKAAPAENSTYWDLMNPLQRLNLAVTVEAFKKQEVIVDVLCFEPLDYQYFGFAWFEINQIVIERMCFFGDLCFTDADIALTIPLPFPFFPQVPAIKTYYGGAMDVVAKMKVDIHKAGAANNSSTFTNINDDGSLIEGQCMEIFWANDIIDDPLNPEIFTINLFVLVGEYFGMPVWMPLATYSFTDNNSPLVGADGVMDFVLGSCGDGTADYPFVWDHPMPYLYIDNVLMNP